MTNTAASAAAGAEAQPAADATSTDSIIDNALAESTKEAAQADTGGQASGKEGEEGDATAKLREPWPKSAENAISRRDKTIGKTRYELSQERAARQKLETELAQYKGKKEPSTAAAADDGAPKEADFKNYADYMEARQAHFIDKKFAELSGKQKEFAQTAEQQKWVAEREMDLKTKAQELAKELTDLPAIAAEYADVVDEYPQYIKNLFLEAENGPLAFYNLAKEGKIETLGSLSHAQAAMEIGRAQAQAPTKAKSNAPRPLPAARGAVVHKTLAQMSGGEILKHLAIE